MKAKLPVMEPNKADEGRLQRAPRRVGEGACALSAARCGAVTPLYSPPGGRSNLWLPQQVVDALARGKGSQH